ncbi:hypothetical protein TCAL_02847 [Tigriopus californicus]|uniref:Coiled-coil domain-containing protein 86 n=1 Tax=Tigriopus californicus TaxID=6832 RepID=A0A553NZB3_TIGCA|nr:coiled-coil domain-containing protein 86-like [Tigriopus californicus]TRY70784.1 hypothetical protein TCAL_02847 [Tigriopus californicus]
MTRVKSDSESSEATLAVRKSRRLSGIRPDLTLQQAQAQVDSPRRSRRHSGGSDVSDASHVSASEPAAPTHANPGLTQLAPIQEVVSPVKKGENPPSAPPKSSQVTDKRVGGMISAVTIPKGKCKSGRFWKSDRDRFRSVIQSKGLKTTFEARAHRKEELQRVKAFEQSLKDELRQKKLEHQQRREHNLKRKEENQKKSEVYQIIKNPAKIKRMKKKQLKMLVKRDVLDQVQK